MMLLAAKESPAVSVPTRDELIALFTRIAATAKKQEEFAEVVRTALAASGLLDVFGAGATLDVVDLLDSGGEDALRARLQQMTLAELKQLVTARHFDEENQSARWRSQAKFIELIIGKAKKQLEEELARQEAATAASWML
jgi:hypothetical protein